ncbi:hypothetical protein ACS0TY_005588 [Phlomoides rotata]
MEVEKRGAKGGFFQLFDWNGKSRKKLFSSKSQLPEGSNQVKESYHGSVIARRQQGLENGFPSNATGHNDYRYASSASGDSEYGSKPPGVVARLMGLDSLPTSTVNEPCFTPYIESHSFRGSSYLMAAPTFQSEHDIVIFESVRNKLDGSTRNPLDPRVQKMPSRPFERFQTEVLPPRSAKPISVSQHRLLSPIKSPGFVPPKNAAYIIEAAAKIIEQSPRSTTKGNFPSLGSPSVPFRVQDFKDKMEAAHRSSRFADASKNGKEENSKNIKKQLNVRGKGQLEDSYLYKGPEESKRASSQRLKSKEKSVSLAIQAKSNIQKRDRLTSVGNRSSEKQKEHRDVKANCVTRDQSNTHKKAEKQSSSRKSAEVLRVNNQKQNCAPAKYEEKTEMPYSHSKERKESNLSTNYVNETSCSRPKERKESNLSTNYVNETSSQPKERKESNLSTNAVNGRTNRPINKIVVDNVVTSRKTNFVAADPGKEVSSSRTKTNSRKRLPMNGNINSGESVSHKSIIVKDEKIVKCNIAFEGDSKWEGIDKKANLDVVSFTFSSPIKKSVGSDSCSRILEASSSSLNFNPCAHEPELSFAASSSGFNVIGGDALSVLLEQKLKELSSRVEFSQKDMLESGPLSSSDNNYGKNMSATINLITSQPPDSDICKSKQEIQTPSDCASVEKLWLQPDKESKGVEYFEGGRDNNTAYPRYLHFQGPVSVSSQPSSSGASSDSFDVDRSSSNDGMDMSSTRKAHIAEFDVEISDTASSLSVGTISSSLYTTDSSNWEVKYIGDILSHAELLVEDFSLGQAHRIIAPDLFDQLENKKMDSYKFMEDHVLERKVLFDCVCECLEVRCGRVLDGSSVFWTKQMTFLNRRQWLVDDLYREISSWRNTEELMVDELVEKDMSSKNGKWINFEIEAFEDGIEIENSILTSLVDELIDDFLF